MPDLVAWLTEHGATLVAIAAAVRSMALEIGGG